MIIKKRMNETNKQETGVYTKQMIRKGTIKKRRLFDDAGVQLFEVSMVVDVRSATVDECRDRARFGLTETSKQ